MSSLVSAGYHPALFRWGVYIFHIRVMLLSSARETFLVASAVIIASAIRVAGHVAAVVVVACNTVSTSHTVTGLRAVGVVIAAVSVTAIDGKTSEISAVVVASGIATTGTAVALAVAVSVVTSVVAHDFFSF